MSVYNWLINNYIEVFGAITGIVYVFLEIKQNIWLWPVGIVTTAVYIWIFFISKFYADMSLQGYYLVISGLGWYWWTRGAGNRAQGTGQKAPTSAVLKNESENRRTGEDEINITELKNESENGREGENEIVGAEESEKGRMGEEVKEELTVTRLKLKTGIVLAIVFVLLFFFMWLVLTRLTDSPVPLRDAFVTSLSIVATWMLARKIYEHWYLWIVVNFVSAILFLTRGLYPTVILYVVYGVMSFVGLVEWKKTINKTI
jgi:nicotinamide mononucleotide transporter